MVITGYRIHTTSIPDIDMEVKKIKRKIDKFANQEYQKLLGKEAAFLYDQMALNVLKRPDIPFLDWVIHELNLKIQIAERQGIASPYNLNVFAQIMTYEDYSYIKAICPNQKLLKAFERLEPYHLSETECEDKQNRKTGIWQTLHKAYEKEAVLSLNLTPAPLPDAKSIVYPSKSERCKEQARHDMTNHYLKQISGGEPIPPHLLMRYLDMAMELLFTDEAKEELKKRELNLMKILPDESEISKALFPDEEERNETLQKEEHV